MTHPDPGARDPAPPGIDRLLSGLTPEQGQAVTHGTGPLLLLAGPGAGKILNAGFTGAVLGSCGPATFPITVSSAGVWAFSATLPPGTPPACFFSGSLPTSPPIKVVP